MTLRLALPTMLDDNDQLASWYSQLASATHQHEKTHAEALLRLGEAQAYLLVDLQQQRVYFNHFLDYSATIFKTLMVMTAQFLRGETVQRDITALSPEQKTALITWLQESSQFFHYYQLIKDEKIKQTLRPAMYQETSFKRQKNFQEAANEIREAIATGAFDQRPAPQTTPAPKTEGRWCGLFPTRQATTPASTTPHTPPKPSTLPAKHRQ